MLRERLQVTGRVLGLLGVFTGLALAVPFSSSGQEFPTESEASPADPDTTEIVALLRVTYKLPPGKSEVLGKLLKAVLSEEGDVKVKGDSLQITATEEDQMAVRGLVKLARRHARPSEGVAREPVYTAPDVFPVDDSDEADARTINPTPVLPKRRS